MTQDRIWAERQLDIIDGEVCWVPDPDYKIEPGHEKLNEMLEQLKEICAACYEKNYVFAEPKPFSMREYLGLGREQELTELFQKEDSEYYWNAR